MPVKQTAYPLPIPVHYRPDQPWRVPFPAWFFIKAVAPTLDIPPNGWTPAEFARQGVTLLKTMSRLAKITQRKAFATVVDLMRKRMLQQIDLVVQRATAAEAIRVGFRSAKAPLTIAISGDIWLDAINEVFFEEGISATIADITPPIQSVLGQGYARTNTLLAQPVVQDTSRALVSEAREIAQRVTRIDETTRQHLIREVQDAVSNSRTPVETANQMRANVRTIERGRINTIARTELNNAWTRGSARSFLESSTVTAVSVIGCEAREANSPHFRGESTCNISMVPISELNALMAVGWHPNHTGTLVPAAFR